MAVCKFCGAPVDIGSICEYCSQKAEPWYYPEYKEKVREAVKPPITTGGYYTVVNGDCLWTIARKAYGDPLLWELIAKENNLKNPHLIYVGQKLYLPFRRNK